MAIVVMEADDLASAMGHKPTSDDPFAQRFRKLVKEVHGVVLAAGPSLDAAVRVAPVSRPIADLGFATAGRRTRG
jgi:hypothetical protein